MGAYDLLLSYTYSSNQSTPISITNIPQGYTDLKIVLNTRSASDPLSAAWNAYVLDFNESGLNRYEGIFFGGGSGAVGKGAGNSVTAYMPSSSTTANTFAGTEIYIPNYTNTNIQKSGTVRYLVENNTTAGLIGFGSWSWASTAAISSVQFSTASPYGNAQTVTNSRIFVYGISNA